MRYVIYTYSSDHKISETLQVRLNNGKFGSHSYFGTPGKATKTFTERGARRVCDRLLATCPLPANEGRAFGFIAVDKLHEPDSYHSREVSAAMHIVPPSKALA